jgi:hypothetical protein
MHDTEALGVIQRVIGDSVVSAGLARMRTLPLTDEQLALDIINALDEQGLRIVRVGGEGT